MISKETIQDYSLKSRREISFSRRYDSLTSYKTGAKFVVIFSTHITWPLIFCSLYSSLYLKYWSHFFTKTWFFWNIWNFSCIGWGATKHHFKWFLVSHIFNWRGCLDLFFIFKSIKLYIIVAHFQMVKLFMNQETHL